MSREVQKYQRYDARMITLEEPALTASDVDGDGGITVIDATWIQRYDLGMKAPEGIGKPIWYRYFLGAVA